MNHSVFMWQTFNNVGWNRLYSTRASCQPEWKLVQIPSTHWVLHHGHTVIKHRPTEYSTKPKQPPDEKDHRNSGKNTEGKPYARKVTDCIVNIVNFPLSYEASPEYKEETICITKNSSEDQPCGKHIVTIAVVDTNIDHDTGDNNIEASKRNKKKIFKQKRK